MIDAEGGDRLQIRAGMRCGLLVGPGRLCESCFSRAMTSSMPSSPGFDARGRQVSTSNKIAAEQNYGENDETKFAGEARKLAHRVEFVGHAGDQDRKRLQPR
jgi:hypothetical protein